MIKAHRIKELRELKGLTQEELAKLLDTKRQTISKYEQGIVTNIPSDKIEAMARIFDTTPEYILGWDMKKVQKNNDAIVDIVFKMRSDENFSAIVTALANDKDFFDAVSSLRSLDPDKAKSIQDMLKAFSK